MEFTVDGFVAQGVTLRRLVQEACGAYEEGRVLGGPVWFDTDHFDIQAKLDPAEVPDFAQLTLPERRQMLRALLASRFRLVVHSEQRTFPVFAMRVAKGGINMEKAKAGESPGSAVKGYDALVTRSRRGLLEGRNFTMADLAQILRYPAGRIVVDQTGLKDRYDFLLQWTPEDAHGTAGQANSGDDNLRDESYPSFFAAVEQELGLKLEPTKTDIEVYVVDHAEQPSSN